MYISHVRYNLFVYDSQSISGLNYECVVGSNTVIPATRVSDTTVVCNIGQGNEVSSICWVTLGITDCVFSYRAIWILKHVTLHLDRPT